MKNWRTEKLLDETINEEELTKLILMNENNEIWNNFEHELLKNKMMDEIRLGLLKKQRKTYRTVFYTGLAASLVLGVALNLINNKNALEKFAISNDLSHKVVLLQLIDGSFNTETGDSPIYDL